jgi:uncharacterized protein (TIGR02466 family)
MEYKKNEWWVTPVWEIETGLTPEYNAKLLYDLRSFGKKTQNVWQEDIPSLQPLREKIMEALDSTVKDYFPPYYPYNPVIYNGWVQTHKSGEMLHLHDHGGVIVACVYYIKASINSGDLLLVDPRGSVNWDWETKDGFDGAKYKRVQPKEGKLVIFPGYVLHAVDPNNSKEERVSIAINIHNAINN